jgi:thiosulfate dehydrogenase
MKFSAMYTTAGVLAAALACATVSVAHAAEVPQRRTLQNPQLSPEFVQKSQEETAKAIQRGDELWHDRNLGTNGMACNMCHPDAAVTHPETYPKYKQQFGRVVSVQQFINWCIQVPLQGKPRELGSADLVALEAYMNDQNRGQVMDIGVPGP